MAQRGPRRVGPSMPERESEAEEGWEYLPVTVLAIFCISLLATVARARPVMAATDSLLAVPLNLLPLYTLNMFMHGDLLHFLGNMFMFVCFGGALTVLTSNRHVLGVVLAAHVPASMWLHLGEGLVVIGSSLALAGVIAATTVRAVAIALGAVDRSDPIDTVLGGTFALAVLAVFGFLSLSGLYYLRIFDHHFGGWVFGGLAELAWLGSLRWRRG